jgi:PAS domain S-box-containing protein
MSGNPDFQLFGSIAHSPIATVITDARLPDNPIVAANRAFHDLTGYSEAEILGRNCRFLAGVGTEPHAQALLRAAVAQRQPALAYLTNYRKDGTPFLNAVMIAPVLEEGGAIGYFLGSQMEVKGGTRLPEPREQRAQRLVASLTPRQRQVLAHMIRGYRNKQIGPLLGIDEKTVKMHRAALLARLGAATSADAIRTGVEAGLGINGPG